MKYSLSKKAWMDIGIQGGWIKSAQTEKSEAAEIFNVQNEDEYEHDTLLESFSNINEISSDTREDSEAMSHVVRDPGSSWGGREMDDGEEITKGYIALLSGDITLPTEMVTMDNDARVKSLETELTDSIKEYGREGAIPDIEGELCALYDSDEDSQLEMIAVDIQSLVQKDNRIFTVTFTLDYETKGSLSNAASQDRADEYRAEMAGDEMRDNY